MMMYTTLAERERSVVEAETDDFKALLEVAGLDPACDLRFADWSGIDFSGADLSGCDFTGARLVGCQFDGAIIAGARFDQAMVDRASLRRAADWDAHVATWSAPGEASSTLPENAVTWNGEPVTWNGEPITCSDEALTSIAASPPRPPNKKAASHRHLSNSVPFSDAPFAPEMVVLPAGAFLMGSPEGEAGRHENEGPQRKVTVGSFAIGRYPVTFAEYDRCCEERNWDKPDDEGWGRGKRPVINVSWLDARAYVSWLTEVTGRSYRLPTEAEWEYACRAGSKGRFCFGDDEAKLEEYAWYVKNSDSKTHPVGQKKPNAWGLYDMHGNVWEWCQDWYGKYPAGPLTDPEGGPEPGFWKKLVYGRVLRGGSWYGYAGFTRSAFRNHFPDFRNYLIGFRVARAL
jgi:formylglycine-generating enzyme required for sulfatase activity